MGLFKRRKDARIAAPPEDGWATPSDAGTSATGDEDAGAPASEGRVAASGTTGPGSRFDRAHGPFDISETDVSGLLDLGAVRIGAIEGMRLHLEIDEEQQLITAATVVVGDSSLQVQAFAAPRSGGLWDEVRDEIATAIDASGGRATRAEGPVGVELRASMPTAGPDGRTVLAPTRFLGVDGPRWFLRGVLSGRAAIDDDAAGPLIGLYLGTVVDRGGEPMAPRELLPLRLPEADDVAADDDAATGPATDINPFERGPEITEVR